MANDQLPKTENTPAAPLPKPAEEHFYASISPGLDVPLSELCKPFAKAVLEYEAFTSRPTWVILQNDKSMADFDNITDELADAIISAKAQFEPQKKISLILHSFGGDPSAGYKIAMFLQKRTGGFEIVIPKKAKSAGTLMALGATKIIMGDMSELGPLDMQVRDDESELWDSALNETKSLQTLSREALVLYAEKMELLKNLYRKKKFETRNRIATEFVNEMIRPLVDKIDAVHYTKMARIMEIMKKYGKQLMKRAGYSDTKLVPCWLVADRTAASAYHFIHDLQQRLSHRVQLTTDGHPGKESNFDAVTICISISSIGFIVLIILMLGMFARIVGIMEKHSVLSVATLEIASRATNSTEQHEKRIAALEAASKRKK